MIVSPDVIQHSHYVHLKRPSEFQPDTNVYLFRSDSVPMWEVGLWSVGCASSLTCGAVFPTRWMLDSEGSQARWCARKAVAGLGMCAIVTMILCLSCASAVRHDR